MQVLDSSCTYMSEGSNIPSVRPVLVEGQRIAVTVKGAAVVGFLGNSHMLTGGDIGSQYGVHVVLVSGFIHHHGELVPVAVITDGEQCRILHRGKAVANGHGGIGCGACPRLAALATGGDMVGGKETVVDDGRALWLAIADEAAIVVAVAALEVAVELTVAQHGLHILANGGNEAAVFGFAIIGAVDGHRRVAVLHGDRRTGQDRADETGYVPFAGLNGTCDVQIFDSSIAHMAEGGHDTLVSGCPDGQRVTVAVEDAIVGDTCSPSYVHIGLCDVGIEAGVHRALALGRIYHVAEGCPVLGIADGEVVVLHLLRIVEVEG